MAEVELYTNIREVNGLKDLIGQTIIDITGNDPDDQEDGGEGCFVELFFEDGTALRFPIDPERGFTIR